MDESARREELERALEHRMTELPENKPKGLLGETGFNIRKVDEFEPDLNAGISQELDTPVVWLSIVLGYLVFFVPGFAILWLSKRIPIRTKLIVSAVGVAGMIAFSVFLYARR